MEEVNCKTHLWVTPEDSWTRCSICGALPTREEWDENTRGQVDYSPTEPITDEKTHAELELNARNRSIALVPVVDEVKKLNVKTEEMIQLLCEIIKRFQRFGNRAGSRPRISMTRSARRLAANVGAGRITRKISNALKTPVLKI